ncbi:hypothetical protein ACFFRR_009969 [Megaselia abdita]
MKTKLFNMASSDKMKSAIFYPYGPFSGAGCCKTVHAKHLAITSAIYTLNISILIVLIYSWRISINIKRYSELEDVYYGVQIAYFAIIGTHVFMMVLSILLILGIYKENPGLIVPWIIGFITFMALEAVAMVYSNVLRDHVNKKFDLMCKVEVAFFLSRAVFNVLAMWGVMRFFNMIRMGVSWKGPEDGCYLYNSSDEEEEDDDCLDCDLDSDSDCHYQPTASSKTISKMFNNKRARYKLIRPENQPTLEVIDELEKSIGSGSEEDDTLLMVQEVRGDGGGGGVAV